MRAREFIVKESKDYAGASGFHPDSVSSLPNSHIYPELDNSSGYLAYRFGVALAGMPDQKMDVAGPTGLKFVTIGYTQAEDDILQAAADLVGTPKVQLTPGGSKELKDTYTTSPVPDWNPHSREKKKKVKESSATSGSTNSGSMTYSATDKTGGKKPSQVGTLFGGTYGESEGTPKKKKTKLVRMQ